MDFRILGSLEVQVAGRHVAFGSGKRASLLGVLLLHANEVVSIDRLVDELWGERPPAGATRLVQGYVHGLRRQLGPDRIDTRPPGYLVRVRVGELDVAQFERLVAMARVGPPEDTTRRLREALALWRGPVLDGLRLAGPAAQEAQRLNELRLAAVLDRVDAELALGLHAQVVGELVRLAAEHPLDERVCAQLMLGLYRSGRQAQALDVYRHQRQVLASELGIDPGQQLRALHTAILKQDSMLWNTSPPSTPSTVAGTGRKSGESPLPAQLRLTAVYPFVGRTRELEVLSGLLPRTAGDGRRIALVGGEAGSGKSRLVREFAHEAVAGGALVLYGACDPVVATPYRPIVEALARLVQVTEPDTLREDLGAAGGELIRLLPDLALYVGELTAMIHADPDTERYRLNTAVGDVLANAGRRQPVLLIVEDGHWADSGTLVLLRHLGRAATHARLLLLVTYRDTEADVSGDFADALIELRRADGVGRVRVVGLTEGEIRQFVSGASDSQVATESELPHWLHDLTAGNAFLLCELWRSMADSDALTIVDGMVGLAHPPEKVATPQGIRDVVYQRLSRLPRSTGALLDLAAVVGTEFEADIVRRAAPRKRLDSLAPAERAGMIEEIPAPSLTYRFTHELVRRAIYDRLTGPTRARLHLRVGRALAARYASPPGPVLAALAHHFTAALPVGEPERAVRYNALAARAATNALAFESAAVRLRTAVGIGVDNDRERAQLLLELGTADLRIGRSLDSLDSFRETEQIARRLGDGELLARAAIGFENASNRPRMVNTGAITLLRAALTALSSEESPLRVRLLAALARALTIHGDHASAVIVRTNAVTMARRINDRRGLAAALLQASWARDISGPEQIVEMVTESRDIATEIGDLETLVEATALRVAALAAAGDLTAAQQQLEQATDMASRLRQPFLLHIVEQHTSALALMQGRLADAEVAAERALAWGRLLTGADPSTDHGIQMFGIRREQGRLAELAPIARSMVSHEPRESHWRAALAALLAELDMTEDVRRELAHVRREGLDAIPRPLFLASLTYLSDACSAVADEHVAALIYPHLEPYARTNLMIGYSVACYGAADRYLGMLAATLKNTALASHHFDVALELNQRMGATTWLAHTSYQYGQLLRLTEPERSETLLAQTSKLAKQVGLPALLNRLRAVGNPRHLPDGLSEREADVLRLLARGLSNRQIGSVLAISEHTTANHVRSILRKTGCANRTDAASYAHRHRLADS
jgi:DNA-binding SARP family transcriptional activator/DNA-binding CsgD family transcriptional regulator/tetratricopeptide (TPR) repeat protein